MSDLKTYFYQSNKIIPAVDGVSFSINKMETVCVVGESGCGKSVTALSVMQLIKCPPGKYVSGKILFKGHDLLKKSNLEMRKIRGNSISMIYQEPMTSLNPVFTIGYQIKESIQFHQKLDKKLSLIKAEEMLSLVGISDPDLCLKKYPHQLSGGMCQRVMIAMALSGNPELLIADEPTTALDVTIQAQILLLLKDLKKNIGMSIMFITHDMGVVKEMADRVIVMYAGKIVEQGISDKFFKRPSHPYTKGLLSCIPSIDKKVKKLNIIKGIVPSPDNYPEGCRFSSRCPEAEPICFKKEPVLKDIDSEHKVACHKLV